MQRNIAYLSIAFLAGTLAGALAVGGYGQISASTESPGDERLAAADATLSRFNSGKADSEAPDAFGINAEPENLTTSLTNLSNTTVSLEGRLRDMTAGWTRFQDELARLQGRVASLEQRLAAVAEPNAGGDKLERPARPNTQEDRRSTLIKSGLEYDLAADLVWRQDRNELDRLELRDLAIREGWYRSDRYRKEKRRLAKEAPDLRLEVGDEIYDRYLFASGLDNHVSVISVIADSPAEGAGIQPGDIVDTYAGERIFTQAELRSATTDGELGELVPVQLRRPDGSRVQIWLPRGPLGIRMGLTRADPEG